MNNEQTIATTKDGASGVETEDGLGFIIDREDPDKDLPLNKDWVFQAFVLPNDKWSDPDDIKNRSFSGASTKWVDGRFGCNIGVNCHPQFTPYADWPDKGRLKSRKEPSIYDSVSDYGLGTFWDEMHDQTAQIIYVQPGKPEFNSLFSYFTGAFDHRTSILARTGRTSYVAEVGHWFGTMTLLSAFPLIAVPLMLYRVADYFFFRQSAKYYHHRPTPHLYWGAVQTLVNAMVVNEGIFPRVMNQNKEESRRLGMPFKYDQESHDNLSKIAPDLFNNNMVDVYGYATRAQRMANQAFEDEFEITNQMSSTDYYGYLKTQITGDGRLSTKFINKNAETPLSTLFERWVRWDVYNKRDDGKIEQSNDPRTINETQGDQVQYREQSFDKYKDALNATFSDGTAFASFRVDHTGSSNESFSNQTQQAEFASKLNGFSKSAQHIRFTMGNGAIMGDVLEAITSGAKDLAMGAISGFTLGLPDSLLGIMGEGYLDVPEHWIDSAASLPSMRYKMTLDLMYSNPISRIFGLYIPFAMVAALAWPNSLGRQSYGAPFIVKLFDPGRVQSGLAMLTNFSVTRGGGNLGFTVNKKPTRFELTFEFKDLSSVLHMPIYSGIWDSNSSRTMIDEESTITNYLAGVCGMSIHDQIYAMSMAKVRAAKLVTSTGRLTSPYFWASATHDAFTNSILKYPFAITQIPRLASRNQEAIITGR